jgi:hypothetical protein
MKAIQRSLDSEYKSLANSMCPDGHRLSHVVIVNPEKPGKFPGFDIGQTWGVPGYPTVLIAYEGNHMVKACYVRHRDKRIADKKRRKYDAKWAREEAQNKGKSYAQLMGFKN